MAVVSGVVDKEQKGALPGLWWTLGFDTTVLAGLEGHSIDQRNSQEEPGRSLAFLCVYHYDILQTGYV